MTRLPLVLFALALAACGGEPAAPAAPVAPAAPAVDHVESKPAVAAPAEATQPTADGWMNYGSGLSDATAVAAAAVIDAPDSYLGKTVKVEGEVSEVCKSMGCWMTFEKDGKELTINMKDHSFSVDKQSAGFWAEAEGEVVKQGELYSLAAHAVRMKKPAPTEEAPAPEAKTEG